MGALPFDVAVNTAELPRQIIESDDEDIAREHRFCYMENVQSDDRSFKFAIV